MRPLYQLVAQYRELQQIDPEEIDAETLAATLDGLGGEVTLKATNVACFVRNLEEFADMVDEAAGKMAERAKRIRARAQHTRGYLLNQMQGASISKIQAPEFTISIRKNPVAVQIKPDAAIPQEYMVTPEPPPPHIDKRKLAEALKAGTVIDGCWLEQGVRLDIR